MSSAQRSKDNENVRVQWRMRTHAQPEEPRASTNASVELENMPVLWPTNASGGHTAGAARTSVYFGILVYTPRPAPLLHYTVVAVPGQHLVMLQRTQPPAETKASLHEQSFLFLFFWGMGPKFLCPNDYWADFFLPSKSLFAPGSEPLRNAQNVGIVCFPLPHPPRTIHLPSLFYALFYASAVGVKSFKDIERVACLISCF